MQNAESGRFRDWSKRRALGLVALAYVLAIVTGALSLCLVPDLDPLWQMAVADVVATVVIFAFSLVLKNSSMYDAYWSVIPVPIVLFWAMLPGAEAPLLRTVLILGLVSWWAVRLTYNWARGWSGLGHEDWRYVNIRNQTGIFYWPVSFLGIHLFPTVQVFLGLIPVYYAMPSTQPFGALDALAFGVTALGIAWEMVADKQLHQFKQAVTGPGRTMTSGVWKYSRHPNYFGEMTFWVGLALFALAAGQTQWWCYIGAVSMIVMFNVVSIPMIDRRMCECRPEYPQRMKQVSRVMPLPPRRG